VKIIWNMMTIYWANNQVMWLCICCDVYTVAKPDQPTVLMQKGYLKLSVQLKQKSVSYLPTTNRLFSYLAPHTFETKHW